MAGFGPLFDGGTVEVKVILILEATPGRALAPRLIEAQKTTQRTTHVEIVSFRILLSKLPDLIA